MTAPAPPRAPAFIRTRPLARWQLRQTKAIRAVTDRYVIRWARRMRRLLHLPGWVDEVYVRGYEKLPLRSGPAPILAFSHKKVHDVAALILFMAARPLERFHDLTYIAQGGLFSGIYAYRDLMPRFARRFLRRPAALVARLIGRFTHRLFTQLHGYPVYRDGMDVPASSEAFEAEAFNGRHVTGMPYAEFVKYAARETRNGVIKVQRDLVEKNRTFVILPEGIYRHDGTVAPLQEFLALTSFRKQRPIIPIALAYDELCPDRWGRITAWVDVAPEVPPPDLREKLSTATAHVQRHLQAHTTITASNLIALALEKWRRQAFSLNELTTAVTALAARACASGFPFDPGLATPEYIQQKLKRFAKTYGRRWFKRGDSKENLRLNEQALLKYADSERTCDDLTWNCNAVKHFSNALYGA